MTITPEPTRTGNAALANATEDRWIRPAGWSLIGGLVLLIARLIPLYAVAADTGETPFPVTEAEIARFVADNSDIWLASHVAGLAGLALWFTGFLFLGRLLKARGSHVAALASVVTTVALGLYAAAMVVDGFAVAAAVSPERTPDEGDTVALVGFAHQIGLEFFTVGIGLLFIGFTLLAVGQLRTGWRWTPWIAIGGSAAWWLAVLTGAPPSDPQHPVLSMAFVAASVWALTAAVRMVRGNFPHRAVIRELTSPRPAVR